MSADIGPAAALRRRHPGNRGRSAGNARAGSVSHQSGGFAAHAPRGVQGWWLNRAAERLMARRISPRMGKPATLRRFYSCRGVIRTETCVKNLSPVRRSAEPFSNDAVKTKLKPSEAGSIWRGGAAQRVSFRMNAEANDAKLAPTTTADTTAELGCGG